MDDLAQQAAGIGALADETRRALYEYVVAQREPVGRGEAATALDLAAHVASFHLDRLVDEGLLETEFRRLTGRTGPGSGRPSKLYRRADREFAVSLPPRQYDLVGEILAAAVARAADGDDLDDSLSASSRDQGLGVGKSARDGGVGAALEDLAEVLTAQGYEAHLDEAVATLDNCPFDTLARRHTALVCGINQTFVQGVADGLGCRDGAARLEPGEGRCCVRVHAT